MNRFLAFFLSLIFTQTVMVAQNGDGTGEEGHSRLWLDAHSKLTIQVSTNVNSFPCEYVSEKVSEALIINYEAIDQNFVSIKNASLSFPLSAFDCGQKVKNKEFREFLNESDYPEVIIQLNGLEIFKTHSEGPLGKFEATIGVAAQYRMEEIEILEIISDDQSSVYSGHLVLNVRDYGLEPPVKFLGLVKVSESIRIDYQFRFIGDTHK